MADFPLAIPTISTGLVDGVDAGDDTPGSLNVGPHAAHHNKLAVEVVAIASGLLTGMAADIKTDNSHGVVIGDVRLSRSAAKTLNVDGLVKATGGLATITKAGVITDSDVTSTGVAAAMDGLLGVDTSSNTLMFRSGGSWRTAAGGAAPAMTFTLASGTSIGATDITLATTPTLLAIGSYVAVGPPTSNCEIRRVTNIAAAVVTLDSALKVAHSAADNVWVLAGFWVPFEWWGARAGSSTFDSYRPLINALLDHAAGTTGYGLVGRGVSPYYSSRPLFIQDYRELANTKFSAFSTFAIDCTVGNWAGIPNQYFMTLAGQFGTATFNASTDVVTLNGNPGDPQYSDIIFYPRPGSTMPGGIEEGRRYFTVTGGSLTTTLVKSQGSPTPVVDITSTGSGEIVWVSSGLARMMVNKLMLDGSLTKGLNGLFATVQQPSDCPDIRIENFPVVGTTLMAQQGTFPNIMVIHCWKGIELAGAGMVYFGQGNVESCEINVDFPEITRSPDAGSNYNVIFGQGFHFESPGQGPSQVQTIYPSATLTAGTFQLRHKNVLTAAINYNATAAQLQSALEAHAAIGAGNVTCTQLSGTNLSNGPIKCDFTVGTLKWEYWAGSQSTTTGGQLEIMNAGTIAGGTLAMSYLHPDGRNISFKTGLGLAFLGCLFSPSPNPYGGYSPAFIKCEGTAVDPSNGPLQGFMIENLQATEAYGNLVEDSLNNITLAAGDVSTGTGRFLASFIRPSRHGGTWGQHWWYVGDGGRKLKMNTAGKSLLELYAGTAQTDNLLEAYNTAGTLLWLIDKDAKMRIGGASGAFYLAATGSPEGSVTAPIGSIYSRLDGGAGTTAYIKESGAGNTGWVAITSGGGGSGVVTNPATAAANTITPTADVVPLTVKMMSGQTANPFEIRDNANAKLLTVGANGRVGIGNITPSYPLDVQGGLNCGSFSLSGATVFTAGSGWLVMAGGFNVGSTRTAQGYFNRSTVYGPTSAQITNALGYFEATAATEEPIVIEAHSAQTADLLALVSDTKAGIYSRFNKAGYFMTRKIAAPADGDVATSELAIWFDDTSGAAKIKFKAKDSGGTVRTGEVALT